MLNSLKMRRWIRSKNTKNFDDFAQRSSHDERRQLFGRSTSRSYSSSQMEPELHHAIAQIKPNERDDSSRVFKHLKQRGLSDRDLERQLGLSTHNPNRMTADDVSPSSLLAYHSHPDIFQDVLAGNLQLWEVPQ